MRSPDSRSALAVAGLAACGVGLLGSDAGVLWIVAGVWTVRAMARTPIDLAWGIACLGAAARWGTLGLMDVAVATRLAGPTVATGPVIVRTGMTLALAAAVLGEARTGVFDVRTWGERAAAFGAVVALVSLFVVRGPGDPHTTLPAAWLASAVVVTLFVIVLRPVAARLPSWAPPALASAGVAVSVLMVTR